MSKWIAKLADTPPQLGTTWGVARSLVAGASALTLLFNNPTSVHILSNSLRENGQCNGIQAGTLTCFAENGVYGWLSHIILLAIFLLVASGVVPRLTGPLHVFAALSFQNVLSTTDGGEHVALVFSVLALPICLVDPRVSHWHQWPNRETGAAWYALENSTVATFLVALRVQISLIYFVASVSKLAVSEWTEGTAVYYWSVAPYLSPAGGLIGIFQTLLTQPVILLFATYVPLILELMLAISVLLPPKIRRLLLFLGLGFHIAIGLLFSIWSFAIIMCAMLLILLGPTNIKDFFRKRSIGQDKDESTPSTDLDAGREQEQCDDDEKNSPSNLTSASR